MQMDFVGIGGKCYGFAAKRFTSPERTDEECRQDGCRADAETDGPIPFQEKCIENAGKRFTFPIRNRLYGNLSFR